MQDMSICEHRNIIKGAFMTNLKKKLLVPGITAAVMLIAVLLACFGIINDYIQTIIMTICINTIMASSLNIVNGYMGEFSCGHAGFMAVGAYVSSVLSLILFCPDNSITHYALLPPELSVLLFPFIILAGGLASMLASLIVAIPSFKTRDDYLAIITIAANYIITTALNNIPAVGASRGLMGMSGTTSAMSALVPIPWVFLWSMIFTALTVLMIHRLMSSTLGKGISAIRYDEISAEIMSVNTNNMKLIAFTFSSGLAGIAGGLFAHELGFINPASFGILKSTESLVMVYLGGMGSLSGSVLSATIFTCLLEIMRPLQIFKWVIIPLMLILIMQFRSEGLMGARELTSVFPKLRKIFPDRILEQRPRKVSAGGVK
jgi:branched-chain amino acid transport system permease protein